MSTCCVLTDDVVWTLFRFWRWVGRVTSKKFTRRRRRRRRRRRKKKEEEEEGLSAFLKIPHSWACCCCCCCCVCVRTHIYTHIHLARKGNEDTHIYIRVSKLVIPTRYYSHTDRQTNREHHHHQIIEKVDRKNATKWCWTQHNRL